MRKLQTVLLILTTIILAAVIFASSGGPVMVLTKVQAPDLTRPTLEPTSVSLAALPFKATVITEPKLRATEQIVSAPTSAVQTNSTAKTDPCLANAKSIYSRLLKPVWQLVQERRREWQKDPRYLARVNVKLNLCRLNILLFGFGETHEPGLLDWGIIGSHTLVSLNLETRKVDLVSLTHDIWSPEVRAIKRPKVTGFNPVIEERISEAYFLGGFPLMKEVLENATGLSVDLELAFKDQVIVDLVKEVFDDRLPVYLPVGFKTYPYWMDKVLYPADRTQVISYVPGIRVFNGREVAGLIKAVPVPDSRGQYPNSVEHNRRKEWVLEAFKANVILKAKDPSFWSKSFSFLLFKWGESRAFWLDRETKSLDFDFDPELLTPQMLASLALGYSQNEELGFPEFGKKIYIVDGAHGDGGVRWTANFMEIPIGEINADGNLVLEYWPSVRKKVEELLTRDFKK